MLPLMPGSRFNDALEEEAIRNDYLEDSFGSLNGESSDLKDKKIKLRKIDVFMIAFLAFLFLLLLYRV